MDTKSKKHSANICLGHLQSKYSIRLSDSIIKYIRQSDKYIDFTSINAPYSFSINSISFVFLTFTYNSDFNENNIVNTISSYKSKHDVVVCILNWNQSEVVTNTKELLSTISNSGADFILGYNSTKASPYVMVETPQKNIVHCIPSTGSYSYLDEKIHYFINLNISKEDQSLRTQISLMPINSISTGTFVTLDTFVDNSRFFNDIVSIYPERLLSVTRTRKVLLHGSMLLEEISKKITIEYDSIGINKVPLGLSFSNQSNSKIANVNPEQYDIYFFDLTRIITDKKWQEHLETYIENLRNAFLPNQLVLLRVQLPILHVKQDQLRYHGEATNVNTQLKKMEDLVIKELSPIVIDVSEKYFRDKLGGFPIAFESYFYDHCAKYLQNIVSGISSQKEYSQDDYEIFFDRVIKYYDSMIACSYQNYFFHSKDAADIIAMNSSAEFMQKYKSNLVYLKLLSSKLKEVPSLISHNDDNEDFIKAAQAIRLILNKNINEPDDVYSIIFKYNFAIIKTYAALLSKQLNQRVSFKNVEIISKIKDNPVEVSKYFRAHPIIKIDIWGSEISKSVVDNAPDFLKINNYVMNQCPALYNHTAIESIDLPQEVEAYQNSTWRKSKIQSAILRDGEKIIEKSTSSWIVIDFYDLVCELCSVNGELFEIDDFIKRTSFYKTLSKKAKTTYLFKEMDIKEIQNIITSFASLISNKYGENIILITTDLKDSYIDLDGSIKSFEESEDIVSQKKTCILLAEKTFAKTTSCYIIDRSKNYKASDRYPLGGANNVHYEEGFYQEACSNIISIIQKNS